MNIRSFRVLALGTILLGLLLGWFVRFHSDRLTDATLPLHEFAEMLEGGHWLGPKEAPVVVLVYQDYLCGYSAELFHTLTRLRTRYPEHVAVVVKNPVDPEQLFALSARVALGAECAAELDSFLEYHTVAFEQSGVLGYRDAANMIVRLAGVSDVEAFEECLSLRRHGSLLGAHHEEAVRIGAERSPTAFVNGVRVVGAAPLGLLDDLVAEGLGRSPSP